jgi:hypothetical protein
MLARGVFGGKNSKLIRGVARAAGDCDVIGSFLQGCRAWQKSALNAARLGPGDGFRIVTRNRHING